MHVAFVNQWYPPETGGGGVATHNYHLAVALARLGHRVSVIAIAPANTSPFEQVQDGVHVIRIKSPDTYRFRRLPLIGRQYRFAQALLYSHRACAALGRLSREHPVDIAEFAEINAEGFFWNGTLSRRLVVRCHTPSFVLKRYYLRDEMPYDTNLLGWAEKRVIRRAHGVTVPSQDMSRLIRAETPLDQPQITVIPNAVDTAVYHAQRPKTADETVSASVNILFVGRLERAKGIDTLVEAIPKVCAAVPKVRFVIIGGSRGRAGGGDTTAFIHDKLNAYIDADQVALRGFVPDEGVLQAYQEADICVVPSLLYESFSLTCAQAMAAGKAVIASRIGGIPETLNHGAAGVIIEPGDSIALAQALITLAHDPLRRETLGIAAQQHADEHFSAENVARRMLDYYTALLR